MTFIFAAFTLGSKVASAGDEINILIALSSHVLCEGLRRIILERAGKNAVCLNDFTGQFEPDILLFDSHQDVQRLIADFPSAKAILLDTQLNEQEIAFLFTCHKIRGIIAPDSSVRLFHKAIAVVNRGDLWVDQKHLKNLLLRNGAMNDRGIINALTSKDKQIVKLISQGLKNREIGRHLFMSEHTVKAHVSGIYRRLNVSNRAQLTSLAKDNFIERQDA